MKAVAAFGLILLAVVSSCAMAQDVVREYRTTARLDVDAHGQVVHVGAPDRVPAMLVASVRKVMSAWRFKSPVVNGKPVPVTTWANATVQIVKQSDKHYGVRVVYSTNGPKLFEKVPPRYPLQARRMRLEAHLLLSMDVELDGSLDNVEVLSHSGKHPAMFARSVRRAIQRWHATPMQVNGKPVVTHIKLPVSFEFHEIGFDSGDHKSSKSAARKLATGNSLPAWAHKPSGQLVATDSPLQRLPDAAPTTTAGKPASG